MADPITSSINLGELRKSLHLKLHEMADALSRFLNYKLPVDRYKNYEYGAVKRIPDDVLNAAARLQAESIRRDNAKPGYIVTVALKAWRGVMAGSSLEDEPVYEREEEPMEIPAAFIVGGLERIDNHEVLRVSGNSMAPRIYSGERVVILKDDTPRNNTIVFVESPERKLFLKRLQTEKGRFVLSSYHEDGLRVENLYGWRIHGYAIAVLGEPENGSRNIEWNDGRPLRT